MTNATEVSIDVAGGTLHGLLARPTENPSGLAVLILPGSGAVDRDGNFPGARNNSLKFLAEGLVAQGITCLRIDKRGVGASSMAGLDESALRFDTYVADAVAWLSFLRAQPGIAAVALIGHSEGAQMASLAAQASPVAAVVLLAGAGRPAGQLIRGQLAAAFLPPGLLGDAERIFDALEAGQAMMSVPPELAPLCRPAVQPYLMSWIKRHPAKELSAVTVPVLIVHGERDLQVSEVDARSLAAAQPAARLEIIAAMNHLLKTVGADQADNLASYNDPARPLAPQLIPLLKSFLCKAS
ncbi:MAG TPA: alpha/beta fold hydrolase [Dongiaceae bacterium]|nr:alpha/beta fold hydrolase [Dongiaceae bacterium]